MRKVGSLENLEKAEIFRWYLLSQNIDVYRGDEDFHTTTDVWIFNDQDLNKARTLLQNFLNTEDVLVFRKEATRFREQWERKQPAHVKEPVKLVQPVFKTRVLWATYALMALAILAFLLEGVDSKGWLRQHLLFSQDMLAHSLGMKNFYEIAHGQVWRLVTPLFLHGDLFHLGFNMIWLFQLARPVEYALGPWRFLALVLGIAIPSHVLFYAVASPFFGGMSGLVFGLYFYMWAYDRFSRSPRFPLDDHLFSFFLIWYVLCWILTALGFGFANTIHGVGGFMGAAFGVWAALGMKRFSTLFRGTASIYNALIVVALLAGGMITDMLMRH